MNAKQTSSTVRRGSAGRPARVSRDDIVRAARRVVDEEGSGKHGDLQQFRLEVHAGVERGGFLAVTLDIHLR
jgi:hypothetical protein